MKCNGRLIEHALARILGCLNLPGKESEQLLPYGNKAVGKATPQTLCAFCLP